MKFLHRNGERENSIRAHDFTTIPVGLFVIVVILLQHDLFLSYQPGEIVDWSVIKSWIDQRERLWELTLSAGFYNAEHAVPPDFAILLIHTEPDKTGFSNDVVFRNESPEPGVCRLVSVVSHHEKVIHLESIGSCHFPVNIDLFTF